LFACSFSKIYESKLSTFSRNKQAYHFVKGFVATPGIEPGLGASETHVLSIVLRG
jgi:hypothetical protein